MRFSRLFWRVLALGGMLWLQWDLWQAWLLFPGLKHRAPRSMLLAAGLLLLFCLVLIWVVWPAMWQRVAVWGVRAVRRLGRGRWLLLAVWVVAFPGLVLFSPVAKKFEPWSARWLLYLVFALGSAFLMAPDREETLRFRDFLRGLLLTGAIFAFSAAYVNVSSYPFPTSWSEGNRLWDYSLMFARDRYLYPEGEPLRGHIDIGRQFLWGLVYLIPGVGIFGVRLWSAILFTVPYLLLAWIVFARPPEAKALGGWAALWGFLFLSQGPIYTPLLLSALLIWIAVFRVPLAVGVVLAGCAGYYAVATRYTWLLAPPLWTLALALWRALSDQSQKPRGEWKRVLLLSGGSLVGGLGSGKWLSFVRTAWALASRYLVGGAQRAQGTTGLTTQQPLIWSRLWPNPTFPLGVLLGVILATGPLFALWWLWKRQRLWDVPAKVLWFYGGILSLFFAIGMVASLKIGGGDNLHNFDMLLVTMLLFSGLFWFQGAWRWFQHVWSGVEQGVLLLLVVAPMTFVFLAAPFRRIPDARYWRPALEAVQHQVHEANTRGGEILFIDHRQLLTFGFVERVPLIPEYEKKYMMDQAMAGNSGYFEQYYSDLAAHRFALIVSEPLDVHWEQEGSHGFAAENNAWVKWVAAPTLCYYEPVATFRVVGLELLVPREEGVDCTSELP